jgi:hypothetical protein
MRVLNVILILVSVHRSEELRVKLLEAGTFDGLNHVEIGFLIGQWNSFLYEVFL